MTIKAILIYSILFYSILFYSILCCSLCAYLQPVFRDEVDIWGWVLCQLLLIMTGWKTPPVFVLRHRQRVVTFHNILNQKSRFTETSMWFWATHVYSAPPVSSSLAPFYWRRPQTRQLRKPYLCQRVASFPPRVKVSANSTWGRSRGDARVFSSDTIATQLFRANFARYTAIICAVFLCSPVLSVLKCTLRGQEESTWDKITNVGPLTVHWAECSQRNKLNNWSRGQGGWFWPQRYAAVDFSSEVHG